MRKATHEGSQLVIVAVCSHVTSREPSSGRTGSSCHTGVMDGVAEDFSYSMESVRLFAGDDSELAVVPVIHTLVVAHPQRPRAWMTRHLVWRPFITRRLLVAANTNEFIATITRERNLALPPGVERAVHPRFGAHHLVGGSCGGCA